MFLEQLEEVLSQIKDMVPPEKDHGVPTNHIKGEELTTEDIEKYQSESPPGKQAGNVYATPAFPTPDSSAPNSGTKRKLDEWDCTEYNDDGTSMKISKQAKSEDSRQQALACPYWKRDPEKYRSCYRLKHKCIRNVKQHLNRRHTPSFYCARCLQVFGDSQRYEAHNLSAMPCFRSPGSQLEGITTEQSRNLSKKFNRWDTEEKQWFAICHILFPGVEKPCSAYVDSDFSEDMSSFYEHLANRGPNILMDELNSSGIWSLSEDQRDVRGRQIVKGVIHLVREQWVSRRSRPPPLPQPSSSWSRDQIPTTMPRANETEKSQLLPEENTHNLVLRSSKYRVESDVP
ncbi:hypothetical protein F5X96DRAFT_632909 [Biscogniauxia mediterranea]|nr:hypothetical protein F5X96DRAFT_632909 [Biscogniauxia mediterranea]